MLLMVAARWRIERIQGHDHLARLAGNDQPQAASVGRRPSISVLPGSGDGVSLQGATLASFQTVSEGYDSIPLSVSCSSHAGKDDLASSVSRTG